MLDTSSERALVALGVRPITLVGTVALEELERAFIVTRTPLQTGDGDPWITLESGAEVIPVTRHALEGDEAPVIFEGRLGCDDVTWQGTVPTAAIGRVVERSERTNTADVQPGVISTQIDLRSADGNTRLRLPTSSFDPLRAAASSFAEDGRVEVDIPFEDFTLNGWVDPGGFAPQTTALAPNPRCLEARPAADVPRPSERDAVLSLPEYTCLLGDDGSIAGVLSPPHVMMLSLGTGTSEDQAPGPTEVGAELVDEHRWRVWVPTLVGELSFIVAETGPSGGYRLCPPPTD